MGLAAFVFFVIPWMLLAAWLFRLPAALRAGVPPTPWRPLTNFAPPGDGAPHEPAPGPSAVAPLAGSAMPGGARLH